MKKKHTFILAALVVLLGVALWFHQRVPSSPTRPVDSASHPPTVDSAIPRRPSVEASSRTEIAPRDANPERKFANMGVLERNAILMEIAKQELPAIFQAMLDAQRSEHDPMKQMGLQTVLAGALKQKTPSPEFLEQLRAFVTNGSNLKFERDLVFGALGSAATPETVKLLAQLATTSPDQKISQAATGSLGTVGEGMGGGEKLSPTLEQVWRESSDPKLLLGAASSMAKIGAPSSIELLLPEALAIDEANKARIDTARNALQGVYRPDAVPPLADRLANQPSTGATAKLVAPILVKIGDAAAGKAVVSWLQSRDENAGALIQDLTVHRTRSEQMLSAWAAALDPAVPFQNEQNREAIRTGLAAWHANRTRPPP